MDNNFNGQNFNPQSNLNNTQYTVNTVPIIPNNNYGAVPSQNYANVQQPQQFGNAQQPQQFGNMQQPYVMPQGYPQARHKQAFERRRDSCHRNRSYTSGIRPHHCGNSNPDHCYHKQFFKTVCFGVGYINRQYVVQGSCQYLPCQ